MSGVRINAALFKRLIFIQINQYYTMALRLILVTGKTVLRTVLRTNQMKIFSNFEKHFRPIKILEAARNRHNLLYVAIIP